MATRGSPRGPEAELEKLRAQYRRALPGKARAVREAALAFVEAPEPSRLETLYLLAHRLRGSAAIYGFAGVSQAAAALEALVAAAVEQAAPRSTAWLEELEARAAALVEATHG